MASTQISAACMDGHMPLLAPPGGLGDHLADQRASGDNDDLVNNELETACIRGTGKAASRGHTAALGYGTRIVDTVKRNKPAVAVASLVALLCLTLRPSGLDFHQDVTFVIPHIEESGEDLYMEDMSWVKETEKKFREEERERERIIDLAKKEEQRIKQQIQRFRRRHRGKPLPQIKKKDIFIPPSAFPEYKPQPRMTESEREAAREKALMEAQQKQEEEEAARRELEAAEYKYLLEGRIKPPLNHVPNCLNCGDVYFPRECSQVPRTLSSKANEIMSKSGKESLSHGQFKFKRHLQFKLTRLKTTNQMPFEVPPDTIHNIVKRILERWKEEAACSFWTRKCVRKSQREIRVLPFENGPEDLFAGRILPDDGDRMFPNLLNGDLGTCAVVGAGANLRGTSRGWEIDQHDSVFRFADNPTEGFEMDVGNKTTVSFVKAGTSSKEAVLRALRETKSNVQLYVFEKPRDWKNLASSEDVLDFKFLMGKLLWLTPLADQVASKLYSLYLASNPAYVSKHKQMPSTGFNLLAALIASRLCHRIDVYGFTSAGGGRYFEPGEYISTSHIAGLEHWFYREAMSEDAMPVCVYD